jgi:hypothetical protein
LNDPSKEKSFLRPEIQNKKHLFVYWKKSEAKILEMLHLLWIWTKDLLQIIQEFGRTLITQSKSNPTVASTIELDKFIAQSMLPRTCDPLSFLKDREALYPGLYSAGKKRLCVFATSIP